MALSCLAIWPRYSGIFYGPGIQVFFMAQVFRVFYGPGIQVFFYGPGIQVFFMAQVFSFFSSPGIQSSNKVYLQIWFTFSQTYCVLKKLFSDLGGK